MQFLKTLFWVLLAVVLAVWASANWRDMTLVLWGHLEADIKIPVFFAFAFALGFLPPWLVLRSRLWQARRRALALEHEAAAARVAARPAGDTAAIEQLGPEQEDAF